MTKKNSKRLQERLRILVANGVNLDLLGQREPAIYGYETVQDIESMLRRDASALAQVAGISSIELTFFQSNNEGDFLNRLTSEYDGILLNPGAWTHTSLALADRLKGLAIPYVEVHLSNVFAREPFRHHSHTAPGASGGVFGFGSSSYQVGLLGLLLTISKHRANRQPRSSV